MYFRPFSISITIFKADKLGKFVSYYLYRCVSFQISLTMVEMNGSESFPNATNEALISFAVCTGPYPPKSVTITLYSILILCILQKENYENSLTLFHSEHGYL